MCGEFHEEIVAQVDGPMEYHTCGHSTADLALKRDPFALLRTVVAKHLPAEVER